MIAAPVVGTTKRIEAVVVATTSLPGLAEIQRGRTETNLSAVLACRDPSEFTYLVGYHPPAARGDSHGIQVRSAESAMIPRIAGRDTR